MQVAETSCLVYDYAKRQCLDQFKDQANLTCSSSLGVALQCHELTVLEKMAICVLMCCPCFCCTRDATIDILGLAGRRPAMKRTHWAAMLDNKTEIGEFLFGSSPYTQTSL